MAIKRRAEPHPLRRCPTDEYEARRSEAEALISASIPEVPPQPPRGGGVDHLAPGAPAALLHGAEFGAGGAGSTGLGAQNTPGGWDRALGDARVQHHGVGEVGVNPLTNERTRPEATRPGGGAA